MDVPALSDPEPQLLLECKHLLRRTQEKLYQVWRAKLRSDNDRNVYNPAEGAEFRTWFDGEDPIQGRPPPDPLYDVIIHEITNPEGKEFMARYGWYTHRDEFLRRLVEVTGGIPQAHTAIENLIEYLNNRPKDRRINYHLREQWPDEVTAKEIRARVVMQYYVDPVSKGQLEFGTDRWGLVFHFLHKYAPRVPRIKAQMENLPCRHCDAPNAQNMASCCQSVLYCGQDCADEDWKRHQKECNTIK